MRSKQRQPFTQAFIDDLIRAEPTGNIEFWWDTEIVGFGIKRTAGGELSYIFQKTLRKDGRQVSSIRKSLGPVKILRLKDVRAAAEQKLRDHYIEKESKTSNENLQYWLDAYLEMNAKLSPRSRADYRSVIQKRLADWLNRSMQSITPDDVAKKHKAIAATVVREAKKGPNSKGEATANGTMRVFRLLWNYAKARSRALPDSPTDVLKLQWFNVRPRKGKVKTEELATFYAALCKVENETYRDYIKLLLFTGLRRRECAMLEWKHIDFTANVFSIPAENTKANRKLDLPMTDYVRRLLDRRRKKATPGVTWVFPSGAEKKAYIDEPKFALREIKKACCIHVSPHDLRRTFATIADEAETSDRALKGLMNHSLGEKQDVTHDYIGLEAERLRKPAQKITNLLKKHCKVGKGE